MNCLLKLRIPVLLTCLLATILGVTPHLSAQAKKPNILVIMGDDIG